MIRQSLLALCLVLGGCGFTPEQASETSKKMVVATAEAQYLKNSRDDIGRFAFAPASGDYPPMLIDTATGCIEVLELVTMVDNPQDQRVARRFADTVLPNITYEDGEPTQVKGSEPNRRCLVFTEEET